MSKFKTAGFLSAQIKLIKGQMKIQPILAARRAVNLMRQPSEGTRCYTLFSAFIANKGATQALTKELQRINYPKMWH